MSKDSLLRMYRKRAGFKTMSDFCKAFKKQTKERLPQPTVSLYEIGMRPSSRRLDSIALVLGLSKNEKKTLEEKFGGNLKPRKEYDHKGYRETKSSKKSGGQSRQKTVSIHRNLEKRKPVRVKDPEIANYRKLLKFLEKEVDTSKPEAKAAIFALALTM